MENVKYICSYIQYNNYSYYMNIEQEVLYMIDINKKQIKWVCRFPWKKPLGAELFVFENSIIAASMSGYQIGIYKPDTDEVENYNYDERNVHCRFICRIEEKIWFFPEDLKNNVIVFDLNTKTFLTVELLDNRVDKENELSQVSFGQLFGEKIYMTGIDSNVIMVVDTNTKYITTIENPIAEKIYSFVIIGIEMYITSCENPHLYVYNLLTKECVKYKCQGETGHFTKPIVYKDGVLIFSQNAMYYFTNKKFIEIEYETEIKGVNTWFLKHVEFNDNIVLLPWTSDYFVTINKNENIINDYFKIKFPNDLVFKYYTKVFENEDIFTLSKFIDMVIE